MELLKQKMSMSEAERAADEMLIAARKDLKGFNFKDYNHKRRLKDAIESLDLEALDKLLEEGKDERK